MAQNIWNRLGSETEVANIQGQSINVSGSQPETRRLRRTIVDMAVTFRNVPDDRVDKMLEWGCYFGVEFTRGNPPADGQLVHPPVIAGRDMLHWSKARMSLVEGQNTAINYMACPATLDVVSVDTPMNRVTVTEDWALWVAWTLPVQTWVDGFLVNARFTWKAAFLYSDALIP